MWLMLRKPLIKGMDGYLNIINRILKNLTFVEKVSKMTFIINKNSL